jgi:hypothetical protein
VKTDLVNFGEMEVI